jgi:regulator of nucleoside diphosphate kinase
MSAPARCCLTAKDFSILEVMLERRRALGDAIVPALERKLAEASVVLVDGVGPGVATLNSRVLYRVGDAPEQTRTLIQQEVRGMVGLGLSVTTPLGLALLGLGEGETATLERPGVRPERVVLDKVLYQPEAARRSRHVLPEAVERRRLVLVHSAGDDWQPPADPLGGHGKIRHRGGDDDGPSAA